MLIAVTRASLLGATSTVAVTASAHAAPRLASLRIGRCEVVPGALRFGCLPMDCLRQMECLPNPQCMRHAGRRQSRSERAGAPANTSGTSSAQSALRVHLSPPASNDAGRALAARLPWVAKHPAGTQRRPAGYRLV